MNGSWSLLAEGATRRILELGRIQSEIDWLAPLIAMAILVGLAVYMARRDTVELGRAAGWMLAALRIAALAGLLVIYLQPQWRNERDVVQNSRAVVLVDTSLSMGVDDHDASATEPTRAQKIAAFLAESDFLPRLRRTHDVLLARFDHQLERIENLPRISSDRPAPKPAHDLAWWRQQLAPRGGETRLGESLRQVIEDQRASPLAGIVLVSDGQQNAGLEPAAAADLAGEANVAVFPVGIGSTRSPANVRISDFVAPARAYPNDRISVTGYLQAHALAGKTVTVELLARESGQRDPQDRDAKLMASQQVTLATDGEVLPVRFEIEPGPVGRRTLVLRVRAPAEDHTPQDNRREAAVQVVDHKTHVLLFAGGPTREYQFLRNQLRRDKEMIVDVLLQTAAEGVSQDANEILTEFPETRAEMFDYDCLIALDPDWRSLRGSQVDLLEAWVGEQAGGLIVIAGPINMNLWTGVATLAKLRDLYPVEFQRRFSVVDDAQYGSKEPWPLEFTRAGLEVSYLWLADSGPASAAIWSEFPGVYGYYAARGAKPGATVLARYSDPRAAIGGERPVYLASQFYGAGRVFYSGSGEMWRLRRLNDSYFDTFYTKLIRFVSQGRLLRGGNRGVLLVERDRYLPGETVEVRAQLTTPQLEPLKAPHVDLLVVEPGGELHTVVLEADRARPGGFVGQFVVRSEGSYRLDLPLPGEGDVRLSAPPIQVTIPDLERERVERNDALLADLARRTGGQYYIGLERVLGGADGAGRLADALPDRSRTRTLAAMPELLAGDTAPWYGARWLLGLICGALALEWLLRRLMKLA